MQKRIGLLLSVIIMTAMILAIPLSPDLRGSPETGGEGTRAGFPYLAINTNIISDMTWDLQIAWSGYRYPYVVERDVMVEEGVTLTIDPGVDVRFNPGVTFTIAGTLEVNGVLFNEVKFFPWKEDPYAQHSAGDWIGLKFLNTASASYLQYAHVLYAEQAVNCSTGSSPTIDNCTIAHSVYYGVYCAANSRARITNNRINGSEWAGIICDTGSDPVIQGNEVYTCLHGIVCYSPVKVVGNTFKRCWLAVDCLDDAQIIDNLIADQCTDGIHAFHSDPLIQGNDVRNCLGNGTRFINSNATVRNNTFRWNTVGLDIEYDAKGVLDNMEGNLVNNIDVQSVYYVGEEDLVIDGLNAHSGWPYGYTGHLTAQGSVTLFDCSNITFSNCLIQNAMNGIFATNSSFEVYDTTFSTISQAEVYLEQNSFARSYNNSVDGDMVTVGEESGLLISYDEMDVKVLDHDHLPLAGATVVIKEGQFIMHNTTTNDQGLTRRLVVKNKTVAANGVISSPLSIQIYADGYNFDPNPMTVYASEVDTATFVDLGDIQPPAIIGVNIENGVKTVPVDTNITIEFSELMDEVSSKAAFTISGNVTGTFTWVGNNMSFNPTGDLAYLEYYTVTVRTTAADTSGNTITSIFTFSFTTIPEPETASWGVMAIAVVSIFAVIGLLSYMMVKKMRQ